MHSLLESYLSEVTAHLGPMPIKQRNEELREMRAHLENAVIVNRELGRSEEEAAQNIVAQFGTPQDLGENVVWAWRRGENKQDKRSFWGAAACTLVALLLLSFLPYALHLPGLTLGVGTPLLAGVVNGLFFSRRAVAGTALGAMSFQYGFGISVSAYWINQPGNLRLVEPLALHVGLFLIQQTEAVLLTLLAVWVSSRLRFMWGKRRRLAQV